MMMPAGKIPSSLQSRELPSGLDGSAGGRRCSCSCFLEQKHNFRIDQQLKDELQENSTTTKAVAAATVVRPIHD